MYNTDSCLNKRDREAANSQNWNEIDSKNSGSRPEVIDVEKPVERFIASTHPEQKFTRSIVEMKDWIVGALKESDDK